MDFELLIELLRSDGSIIVNKRLAKSIGIDAAIIYSELASKYKYFKNKNELTDDGFFFNTVENMEEDTTLSKYQQNKALKVLCNIGLIKQVNRGLPQKRYFKIISNMELLQKCLQGVDMTKVSKKSKNSPIRSKKTEQIKGEKLDGNNTKNNTKSNNTNNLHHLNELNDDYVLSYLNIMSQYGYKHKRVTTENLLYIENSISEIKSMVDMEEWKEAVRDHFDTLSKRNDGDIMAFLKASKRYFNLEV